MLPSLIQAPQHIARIVPRIRGASRPLGPGDPRAHGRGEEAARGDLHDHGGQGSVRSLTACVSIAKSAHRKGESLLTEL